MYLHKRAKIAGGRDVMACGEEEQVWAQVNIAGLNAEVYFLNLKGVLIYQSAHFIHQYVFSSVRSSFQSRYAISATVVGTSC